MPPFGHFSRLVEPSLDALFRLARRLTRSRSEAEELAQEVLVRAFERSRELRDPASARVLLFALARQIREARALPSLLVLQGEEPAASELLLALRELPEDESSGLWLQEVEGLSEEELASVLGTNAAGARARLARARAALLERPSAARAGTGDRPWRATLVDTLDIGVALRGLPIAGESAPGSLAATLRGLSAGASQGASVRPRARGILVVVLAALAGALAVGVTRAPLRARLPEVLALEVAARHLESALPGGVEVSTSSPAEVSAWLTQTLGQPVTAPPPDAAELVGARRCYLFGQPAAAVVYRKAGALVTLLLPGDRSAAAAAAEGAVGTCSSGPEDLTLCVLAGGGGLRILAGELPGPALCAVAGR